MNRNFRLMCLFLAAGFVLSLAIDLPVSTWIARGAARQDHARTPGELRKLLSLSEVFSHGTGVVLILLTIYVVVPGDRRFLLRLTCSAFGGGLAADIVKLFVQRTRPAKLGLLEHTGTVGDTFGGFAFLNWESATQSFPSAHTATAVGLAVGLSHIYPRGKWLFATFALLAALQRIQFLHHYPSDVLGGALVGMLMAGWINSGRGTGRLLQRWEAL